MLGAYLLVPCCYVAVITSPCHAGLAPTCRLVEAIHFRLLLISSLVSLKRAKSAAALSHEPSSSLSCSGQTRPQLSPSLPALACLLAAFGAVH